jgi:hypothetical protein
MTGRKHGKTRLAEGCAGYAKKFASKRNGFRSHFPLEQNEN